MKEVCWEPASASEEWSKYISRCYIGQEQESRSRSLGADGWNIFSSHYLRFTFLPAYEEEKSYVCESSYINIKCQDKKKQHVEFDEENLSPQEIR